MKLFFSRKIMLRLVFPLALILAASSFFFLKNSSENLFNSTRNYEIQLTPEGFKPESLTIKKGSTVTFINLKGGPAWPASDPHPAHTNYSEFDSMKAVPDQQNWAYTFSKVGVWKFHDHLSPYFTGKITVVDENGQDSFPGFGCGSNSETKNCWEESLLLTLNRKGFGAVLEEVNKFYDTKPLFAESCHDIMHSIGHQAYKNYLQDRDSVLDPRAFYCANGFYHGFMASFLDSNPDLNKAREFCSLVGEKLVSEAPDAELQCYHGIGHGLLEDGFQQGKIFTDEQSMVLPALANCEKVVEDEEQLYRCVSGMFNGIANFYIKGDHNLKVNESNPLYLCEIQDEKYKEACYGNLNSTIFWLSKNNFSKASQYVVKMKDKKYQEMSMTYLSGLATLSLAKVNPEKAITDCRATGELRWSCIKGFAHGFLEHGSPTLAWREAVNFCSNPMLNQDEAETCLGYTLSNLRGWYSKEKSEEICTLIKPEYKKYCRNI